MSLYFSNSIPLAMRLIYFSNDARLVVNNETTIKLEG